MGIIIRARRSWKDILERHTETQAPLTRRDFLKRGLATTTMSTLMPTGLAALLARSASAQATCAANTAQPGGLMQLYRDGGACMGATFLNAFQACEIAGSSGAAIALDYGITSNTCLPSASQGGNWWVDPNSAFGMGVLLMPPNWAAGQSAWTALLQKTYLGGYYGPFSGDDAVGRPQGQMAGCGPLKISLSGMDVAIDQTAPRAPWSASFPAYQAQVASSAVTPSILQNGFEMVPAPTPSTGINGSMLINSAYATDTLSQVFASLFSSGKTGQQQAYTNAMCGFYGDQNIANPTFAPEYFQCGSGGLASPTNLQNLMNSFGGLANFQAISPEMQSFLVASYQSSLGIIGGVSVLQQLCDYHPPQVQTFAGPNDLEAGQIFAMWLAGAYAAGSNSAFIMNSNGRTASLGVVLGQSTQSSSILTGTGSTLSCNTPITKGDAGGTYNAGMIILYSPTGTNPNLGNSGTWQTGNNLGYVAASNGLSVSEAMAGLYLTALSYINPSNAPAVASWYQTALSLSPSQVAALNLLGAPLNFPSGNSCPGSYT